jgi:hypothetical protein
MALPFPYSLGLLLFEVLGLCFFNTLDKAYLLFPTLQAAVRGFFFSSLMKKRNN